MRGYILLEGGAEFGGQMAEADMRAIELAGGVEAPISIIPAAAAPDNNHERAGHTGVRWFKSMGAKNVALLPLLDSASAHQSLISKLLLDSRLIYLLGGFPAYLAQTLAGSKAWQAILQAYLAGAVIGGSSAGAMVLCQHCYDPSRGTVIDGLNLIPGTCVIPHYDSFGNTWASPLATLLPEDVLIGICEQTGMIDDGEDGEWKVYGKGWITIGKSKENKIYHPGDTFSF
jgi:cyanophycinase